MDVRAVFFFFHSQYIHTLTNIIGVILVFEFHAILTKWNAKYKKITCLLPADGAGALFYFLLLAMLFYFYFNFLFKRASKSEDQGINLVWPR